MHPTTTTTTPTIVYIEQRQSDMQRAMSDMLERLRTSRVLLVNSHAYGLDNDAWVVTLHMFEPDGTLFNVSYDLALILGYPTTNIETPAMCSIALVIPNLSHPARTRQSLVALQDTMATIAAQLAETLGIDPTTFNAQVLS